MKKRARVALNVVVPPTIATVLLVAFVASRGRDSVKWDAVFPLWLLMYAFATIPSILFALLMEWSYGRGIQPDRVGAIAVSMLFGSVAALFGLGISVLLTGLSEFDARALWSYPIWGALTGLVTGLAVLVFSRAPKKEPNQAPEPTP